MVSGTLYIRCLLNRKQKHRTLMETRSWKDDVEIREHIDDLLTTIDSKMCLIMPMMKPYIESTQEWKLFLGATFFINQYTNARRMDFNMNESVSFAIDTTLKLPYVTELLEMWIRDGVQTIPVNKNE